MGEISRSHQEKAIREKGWGKRWRGKISCPPAPLEVGTAGGRSQLYCQKEKKHQRKTDFSPSCEMRLELKCIQCGCQWWQRLRNEKIAGSQNITAPKKGLSEQLRTSCTTKLKQWHRRSLNIFPGPCTMEFPQGRNKSCYSHQQILQGSGSAREAGTGRIKV